MTLIGVERNFRHGFGYGHDQPSPESYCIAFKGLVLATEALYASEIKEVKLTFPYGMRGTLRYEVKVLIGNEEVHLISKSPDDGIPYAPNPFTPTAIAQQFLEFLGRKLSSELNRRRYELEPLQGLADAAKRVRDSLPAAP